MHANVIITIFASLFNFDNNNAKFITNTLNYNSNFDINNFKNKIEISFIMKNFLLIKFFNKLFF